MTVPLLRLLGHAGSPVTAGLLVLAALAVISCYTSISGLVKAELFPGEVRALGVGLPYAVSNALFGGTAEYVGLWFKSVGAEAGFFWYVTGFFVLALVTAWAMPETRRESHLSREYGMAGR
jgi:MHS family alpha-ketoglutarate permease-like MFS transporter